MNIRLARHEDFAGIQRLATQVEELFGPVAGNPEFEAIVRRNIDAGVGLVAEIDDHVVGGLLFTKAGTHLFEIGWLVVDAAYRSQRVGQALLVDAMARWVHPPADIEVVAFGPDHPGAASVAFYERLGFEFVEPEEAGPEGGSRDRLRLSLDKSLPSWATG
jgi:GNAT superfamily N-acetyltransferase